MPKSISVCTACQSLKRWLHPDFYQRFRLVVEECGVCFLAYFVYFLLQKVHSPIPLNTFSHSHTFKHPRMAFNILPKTHPHAGLRSQGSNERSSNYKKAHSTSWATAILGGFSHGVIQVILPSMHCLRALWLIILLSGHLVILILKSSSWKMSQAFIEFQLIEGYCTAIKLSKEQQQAQIQNPICRTGTALNNRMQLLVYL